MKRFKAGSQVLITGGAGFIGSSLASKIAEDDINVVIVDNLLTGKIENVPGKKNVKFIKADGNDFDELSTIMLHYKFDYAFHYAAVVGVQRTQENPQLVLNDIEGIKSILRLSKNLDVKRVFFSSSSEVYGEPIILPQNEKTTPLNSILPYAVVKNVGETYLRAYHKEYNLEYTIFRFFNTYGPKQSTDFVISKFINSALKNEDITIYGDGQQTRTFLYVDNNIQCCLSAFYNDKCVNEVVNIGSDTETTIRDLAELIVRLTKSKSKIVFLPPLEAGDMRRRQPDIQKMKKLLEGELIPLEEGIGRILKETYNVTI